MMLRRSNLSRILKVSQYTYSTLNSSAPKVDLKSTDEAVHIKPKEDDPSKLVAAAFASLKEISIKTKHRSPSTIDVQVAEAADIDSLLAVTDDGPISRHSALKIVSKLADWATMGRVKISDFDTDIRFAKICRLLGQPGSRTDLGDLSVVLGVTADEQAAKLISSISLPQMIKVMSSLTTKGRRSTPLLRSLAFNIGRSSERLDIKQAADVFYACAALNFPDEVLLAKVTADITSHLNENKMSSVISSIVKSAGILKYRDTEFFENLCNWMVSNPTLCRAKEYISLVLALANVNYLPEKFSVVYKSLKPHLKEQEMTNYQNWLDVVWSLVILQKHDENLIQSVLQPDFFPKLAYHGEIPIATKMKLLNVNGVAQQLGSSYNGPLLPNDSDIHNIPLVRMKEKQLLVNCITDTVSNITSISEHFKANVNSDMGFLIDFECRMDSKSRLIKLSDWKENEGHKVAIMICTYHDVCRGSDEAPNGITALNYRLLENANYKLLVIPYNEFNPRDKLITRVQYLESKLKNCIQEG